MSDNQRRFSAFVDAERSSLIAAAQRARVFDHRTNRGSEYERSIRAWVLDFVEPEYTVSEGEVIDSFNTHQDKDSRQIDAIVHKNTRHARRFTFGGGVRLVPIESVALMLEVKLAIDASKFQAADASAQETNDLRLAVDRVTRPNRWGAGVAEEGREAGPKEGTRVADAFKRVCLASSPRTARTSRPSPAGFRTGRRSISSAAYHPVAHSAARSPGRRTRTWPWRTPTGRQPTGPSHTLRT